MNKIQKKNNLLFINKKIMKDSIIVIFEIFYYILSLSIFSYIVYMNYFLEILISYLFILNVIKSFFVVVFILCYIDKINKYIILEQYMIVKILYYLIFIIIDSIFLNKFYLEFSQLKYQNIFKEWLSLMILYSIDISFEIVLLVVFLFLFGFYMKL